MQGSLMAPKKTPAAKTQAQKVSEEKEPELVSQSPATDPAEVPVVSKSAKRRIEALEEVIVKDAKQGVQFAEDESEKVVHSPAVEKAEEISVEDLRKLHDEAIIAEDTN